MIVSKVLPQACLGLAFLSMIACSNSDGDSKQEPPPVKQKEVPPVKVLANCPNAGLAHGESKLIEGYSQAVVSFGESCNDFLESVKTTCFDGNMFSESDKILSETCEMQGPKNCDEAGLNDGETRVQEAYLLNEVRFNESCEDIKTTQTLTCTNGKLTNDQPDYVFTECKSAEPRNCELNGETIKDGETKKISVYLEALVAYNESCETHKRDQTYTCEDGILTHDGPEVSYPGCKQEDAKSCDQITLENGEPLTHGKTIEETLFSTESVAYDSECRSGTRITKCENGEAIITSGAEFKYTACQKQEAQNCERVGLDHGETSNEVVYKLATAIAPQTCESLSGNIVTTCINGTTKVSEDSVTRTEFPHSMCEELQPKNCETEGLNHGETINLEVFSSEVVSPALGCDSVKDVRSKTCVDGKIEYSGASLTDYPYETCEITTDCSDVGLNDGESRSETLYEKQIDLSGECASAVKTTTCNNGIAETTGTDNQHTSCKAIALSTQYWVHAEDGSFTPPWETDNPTTVDQEGINPSLETTACEVTSREAILEAFNDDEINQLFDQAFGFGATQNFILVVSDIGSLNPEVSGKRDRYPYFWHWNQSKQVPALSMSRFDRGSWVWEATVHRGTCYQPQIAEMKRYLKYIIKNRLEKK